MTRLTVCKAVGANVALFSMVLWGGCHENTGTKPPTPTDAGGDGAIARDLASPPDDARAAPDQSDSLPDGSGDAGGLNAIGRPCTLPADAGAAQAVYSVSAGECPSGICLKPILQQGAAGSLNTAATCTAECTQDSDCVGEIRDPANGLDRRCVKGFTCAAPFAVGALCCRKLCVCNDFQGPSGAMSSAACAAGAGGGPGCTFAEQNAPIASVTGVGEETDVVIGLKPPRQLDLVAMIDDSPGMAPKVNKLNAQFPKLIAALKDPDDGSLPDLRVAIIDSDLGTGNAYTSGTCGPKTLADGMVSPYGDLGRLQMPVSPSACTINSGAQFLDIASGAATTFTGDVGSVFGCLTQNLGTLGCGEEHQLQAFEFALAAKGIGNESQQSAFLRASAYLGLLFLTDEDDCSAATNDGMFGPIAELRGETPSLRCATRGHMCNGQNLANSPPGYPTDASFSAPFNQCQARTDTCPNQLDGTGSTDTSVPTSCSPLVSVRNLANVMKGIKNDPDHQITVAGIFGWPLTDADLASAVYKIAPVPNPDATDTRHAVVYDYWPVCYDPYHLPSPASTDSTTGFDTLAASWGATGGLREAAFVDEFGSNGFKFSACQPDYTSALDTFGTALARKWQGRCLDYKLVDADDLSPGLQPSCRVVLRTPKPDPNNPSMTIYVESPSPIPQCPAGATGSGVTETCWQLVMANAQCPNSGQYVSLLRSAADIGQKPQLDTGTKLVMQCQTCPSLAAGAPIPSGCDY